MKQTKQNYYWIKPLLIILVITFFGVLAAISIRQTAFGMTAANGILWFVIFFVLSILFLEYLGVFIFYGRLKVVDRHLVGRGFLYQKKSNVDLSSLSYCLFKKRGLVSQSTGNKGANLYYVPDRLILQDTNDSGIEVFTAGWTNNHKLMQTISTAVSQAHGAQVDKAAKMLLKKYQVD